MGQVSNTILIGMMLKFQRNNLIIKGIIAEMFYVKKENSTNVIIDLKDYNFSYDMIFD